MTATRVAPPTSQQYWFLMCGVGVVMSPLAGVNLSVCVSPQWNAQATCATQGTGLYEGLDWLSNELAKH